MMGVMKKTKMATSPTSGLSMNTERPKKKSGTTDRNSVCKRALLTHKERTSGERVDSSPVYSQVGK